MGKSVDNISPPWLQTMNLRPCHLPTESICPKMPKIKRQSLQCFGDGIINCDASVGSMCKLFERQTNPSNQLDDYGANTMTVANYFFCNQPLTTAECMGIIECMSSRKLVPTTTELPMVEVTSSTSSIVEILKENSLLNRYETEMEPEIISPNQRYYTGTKEYQTTTTATMANTGTEISVTDWPVHNTGVSLGNRQSLKHEPNLVTNKKNQKLSRMQVGMIGALIALGSFMFIAVAAVAYYS